MFTYAVDSGIIATSPTRGISTPADGRRSCQLDPEAYKALGSALEAAEARLEPWQAVGIIRLLALTGARKGEIRTLRLSEVDTHGRRLLLEDSKTGAGMRALGDPAVRVLRTLLTRPNRPDSPYVFPGRDPRRPFNGLGGAWDRIVGKKFTPHGLRHAFATTCDELGMSELTVSSLLGHVSARTGTVTRGYISKRDTVLLAAADEVSEYIWRAMNGAAAAAVIPFDRTG